jgi:hypothetical protein
MPEILYPVNPDRNVPWNDLSLLAIRKELYQTTEILEKLADAKAVLRYLDYRMSLKYSAIASQSTVSSVAFPNFS